MNVTIRPSSKSKKTAKTYLSLVNFKHFQKSLERFVNLLFSIIIFLHWII